MTTTDHQPSSEPAGPGTPAPPDAVTEAIPVVPVARPIPVVPAQRSEWDRPTGGTRLLGEAAGAQMWTPVTPPSAPYPAAAAASPYPPHPAAADPWPSTLGRAAADGTAVGGMAAVGTAAGGMAAVGTAAVGTTTKPRRRWPWATAGLVLGLGLGVGIGNAAAGGASTTAAAPPPAARTVTVTAPAPAPQTVTVTAAVPPPAEQPAAAAAPAGPASTVGDGVHQVGTDIASGRYKTDGPRAGSIFPNCYYARLKNDSGQFDAIIANGNLQGPGSVSVKQGEFVEFSGGCTWTKA